MFPKSNAFSISLADKIINTSDFFSLNIPKSITILASPSFIPGIDGTGDGRRYSIQLSINAAARSIERYASLDVRFNYHSSPSIVIITFAGRQTIFSSVIEINPFFTHILSGHSDEITLI